MTWFRDREWGKSMLLQPQSVFVVEYETRPRQSGVHPEKTEFSPILAVTTNMVIMANLVILANSAIVREIGCNACGWAHPRFAFQQAHRPDLTSAAFVETRARNLTIFQQKHSRLFPHKSNPRREVRGSPAVGLSHALNFRNRRSALFPLFWRPGDFRWPHCQGQGLKSLAGCFEKL